MDKKTADMIKQNVMNLMELRGIPSGNALAKLSGLSQRTISNILAEDEFPNPSVKVLSQLADSLGVKAWMLLLDSFPFDSIGLSKPLQGVSHEGYRLLRAYEDLPDDRRKAILDFAIFQAKENDRRADLIREARQHYEMK